MSLAVCEVTTGRSGGRPVRLRQFHKTIVEKSFLPAQRFFSHRRQRPRLQQRQPDRPKERKVRIFIVDCEHEQKTSTSGEVHQMRSASLQRYAN